ncbi:hypothetical protein ACFQPF_13055 [Fictibacillus iocasae]|uniref:Uncharacterized protein n=1 Tax=Fictibacillus iocasae TaxID=2715437 RepID=A0ABW2NTD0_9BACL
MNFKDFLMKEYKIGEKSAEDYVGRLNGMEAKGIYRGEKTVSYSMKAAIEREYPKSKHHYLLTMDRYMRYKQKRAED